VRACPHRWFREEGNIYILSGGGAIIAEGAETVILFSLPVKPGAYDPRKG